ATGYQGRFHVQAIQEFGGTVVAGVTPGKSGEAVHGVPIYDTMQASMEQEPNASLVLVPAPQARDAVFEGLDAGIQLVVVVTDGVPLHDAMDMVHYARCHGAALVGPNCPGIVSPGKAKVGIIPNRFFIEGCIGVASRSGTLTYEVVNALSEAGLGQSTVVGLGGDPVIGTSFCEVLACFNEDSATDAVVLVGEIGGTAEHQAAAFIANEMDKPVYGYIAGRSAPPGQRMGHAGAIISGQREDAATKITALEDAGVTMASFPHDIPELIRDDGATATN
ncbi:MAG: succinate--CoA ligase subunit alpha, partial [Thermoplasmatota archaeon]